MGFVRGKAKDHGKENRIEGKVFPGMKTVVIEDLISTAGSSVDAVNALRDAGCDVLGIVSIFTYNLKKGEETLKKNDVENTSLTDYDELIEAAIEDNYIESASLAKLMEWKKDPSNEDWMTK
jgi:orotate phosphoribosyltransferase